VIGTLLVILSYEVSVIVLLTSNQFHLGDNFILELRIHLFLIKLVFEL
jgi:hypothetical protein